MADASISKLEWKGRKIAARVWVRTASQKFLFHTTPAAAIELLKLGAVEPEPSGKKLWCLELLSTPGPMKAPATYKGVRYVCSSPMVFLAKQGNLNNWNGARTYEFKRLSDQDRWAYILAITMNRRD